MTRQYSLAARHEKCDRASELVLKCDRSLNKNQLQIIHSPLFWVESKYHRLHPKLYSPVPQASEPSCAGDRSGRLEAGCRKLRFGETVGFGS
ncbi:hypothetical protein H6H01_10600 [Nostoc calcicola FACHB-3891]|nr:hypothetical protein [Nostoc calcicola FACHB-3891]